MYKNTDIGPNKSNLNNFMAKYIYCKTIPVSDL